MLGPWLKKIVACNLLNTYVGVLSTIFQKGEIL